MRSAAQWHKGGLLAEQRGDLAAFREARPQAHAFQALQDDLRCDGMSRGSRAETGSTMAQWFDYFASTCDGMPLAR